MLDAAFIFRCPYTGYRVQGYDVNDDESERADRAFVGVTCAACRQKVKPAHGVGGCQGRFRHPGRGKVRRSHPQRHHRPQGGFGRSTRRLPRTTSQQRLGSNAGRTSGIQSQVRGNESG
jgi:hypothetical protein